MTAAIRMLVDQALALPEESRAFLAEKLLESLDQDEGGEMSAAWHDEILRRCQEIDEGNTTTVPVEEMITELREQL